ncbi:MAG: M28 family peptidase [Candidatus Thermoplasmatota archaeon]|nr:M28 family peptidase [Candidatus Thermoplasmatota archaeon]MEE2649971.1 M28 family peptidase [Candidatus Thermoplasmatota archaeon]
MSQWASKTVDELKQELRSRGMPVSGKKSELVERLELVDSETAVLEAEIVVEDAKGSPSMVMNRLKGSSQAAISRLRGLPVATMVVAVIMVVGTTGGALLYSDDLVEWIQGEPDYALIDFDSNQTRAYAEGLVGLGHPEWEGRLSGTEEEENTAQSIKLNFSSSGMPATLEEFEVPLFYMGNEFEIMICTPGNVGNIFGGPAPCSVADVDRDETEFTHREDYVVQGYSGDVDIVASSDVNVIDLGIGNESADWGSAANGIGLVWLMDGQEGGPGTESNTVLLLRAQENSLRGLITVNAKQNCDELISGDCVPYFKSVDITQFDEKPYDIGFVMVSKSVGEMIADRVVEGEGMLQFVIEVDNQVNVNVHVPCGIIEGESASLIIIGAHHDTVYNGQGAVDNTAGTATVQEMARQFGLLQSELGQPKHTIYFCTWGGEEQGLWGSSEWVKKHQDTLRENLRLYVNLDMNHVDAQRNSGLTLQGNSPGDVERIEGLVSAFAKSYPDLASKYEINVRHLDSEQMPYNSDHAPFVYNLDEGEGGDKQYGKAVMCYGSGSEEYHTYLDSMDRFNEESLMISGIVYGSLVRYLAWG